jgi:phosphoribosylaminoimidazolecarboxamide formyltransferase/IMP cyclohydrolase
MIQFEDINIAGGHHMRALISVSDKTGIQDFAKGLVAQGYSIISTGGTANVLRDAGINVIPIDDVTGFPEMMDGRVKTLHPNIHGGLLARRNDPNHMAAAEAHGISMIDMVVVNLYPFESTIQKQGVSLAEAIENIDIGGPSMLRSAAKNFESVAVVVSPTRYGDVLANLVENKGQVSNDMRQALALEAFQHTANYDTVISNYLAENQSGSQPSVFPETIAPVLKKVTDLRYGENPHQSAAFYTYSHSPTGLNHMVQRHGKELSYNNIVDLEAAWHIVREFKEPAVAIVKHTNPCGAAIADSLRLAYKKAYEADTVSAFGSIIGCNQPVDVETATLMADLFVEAIIAPSFTDDAFKLLSKKAAIRLVELPHFYDEEPQSIVKYVQGGMLLQSPDNLIMNDDTLEVVTKRRPDANEIQDLKFAFAICKHVKSNAIVLVKNGQSIGIGAGQMSRIEAVEIAIKKAGGNTQGAVCASDAFFPFGDSVEALAPHGVRAIIQPGGSKRDQDSIDASNAHDMAMVMTGIRHFKH